MKYIDADRLKEAVEKKYNSNDTVGDRWDLGYDTACEQILDIIDSLQQEQPEVDLEKKINACWRNWLSPSNQKEVEGVLPKTEFAMYARHFYNLGLNARKV